MRLANALTGTRAALGRKYRRRRTRRATIRELSALDDRILNDIGMRRGDIPQWLRRGNGCSDAR